MDVNRTCSSTGADVAGAAGLFADPTRADMISALLDGRARTAGELARMARVSAPTVSSHLRRLLEAAVVAVEVQGRHRYYRLADARAIPAFEALAALAPRPAMPVGGVRDATVPEDLRVARTCYDHLAGAVAVRLADALVGGGLLVEESGRYTVTPSGTVRFLDFGLDLDALRRARRAFAPPCLDWSERRHHVAGAVGAALLARMVELGWLSRPPASRAVHLHPAAREGMARVFGCDLPLEVGPC